MNNYDEFEIGQDVIVETYAIATGSKKKKVEMRHGVIKSITPKFINIRIMSHNSKHGWEESFLLKDIINNMVTIKPKIHKICDSFSKEVC
jgi:hypothetical protein